MDSLNWARALYTLGCFIAFVLILIYTYGRKNKNKYQMQAQAVVDDPDLPSESTTHLHRANREHGANE